MLLTSLHPSLLRALFSRFFCCIDNRHFQVWVPSTSTILTCRASDFIPYNLYQDPAAWFRTLQTASASTSPFKPSPLFKPLRAVLPRTRAKVTYTARASTPSSLPLKWPSQPLLLAPDSKLNHDLTSPPGNLRGTANLITSSVQGPSLLSSHLPSPLDLSFSLPNNSCP